MKRKILFIIAATMLLSGCKKYIDYSAIKFEITNEELVVTSTTTTLTADYSWPWKVVSIVMEVSEDEGFANAKSFEASVSGNSLTVTATGLKAETTYYYRMRLNMEDGKVESEKKTLKTTAYILPTVTTSEVTNISGTKADCRCNVTSEGDFTVTARGVCWNTNDNPTIDDSHTVDGSGAGSFISNITGLTENTTYYVRAYATSSAGTAYGATRTFKTTEYIFPTVTTYNVNNITYTTAKCGGVVTEGDFTVTARGVCWGTTDNPTIDDSHTVDGSGAGSFISNITGLTENTTYYVRAYATSSAGTAYGATRTLKTTAYILPTVTTSEVTNVSGTKADCRCNVTSEGDFTVTARGVCWSTTDNPTLDDSHTVDGGGAGAFISNITGLTENTTYYVRAYATSSAGTVYGETRTFKTTEYIFPTVTTSDVNNITSTTAKCGGEVTEGDYTVTARGVCWNTADNPTIDDSHTVDGGGAGSFTSNITGLTEITTYYVRAYATSSAGTVYGETRTFVTTEYILPTVTTSEVDYISATTAKCGGEVTEGDYTVTARGVCWNTADNPTIDDSHTVDGGGAGSFTSNITGLTEITTYYVRAYATSSAGTVYGETRTFVTTEYILPTVTTSEVDYISATTAKCGGEVTEGDFTVTARGVCWSTADNPTIDDSHTVDGGGAGSFTSNITGLTEITTYYVRAYATSSAGTVYGETRTFVTNNPNTFTVNGVSFEMVYVEGGSFDMGATTEQGSDASDDEYPVHSVTLSDYYIGKCEVTQELWEAVMGSNPSHFKGAKNPVERVSWNDCQEFVSRLNSLTGMTFRLPTEAEWEYAARGGNQSLHYKYSGSDNIGDVAWYDGNSGSSTHAVGTKTANELGIYDMSGNVWEWCSDRYGDYSAGAQTNPQGPSSGSYRVLRGGSWGNDASYCRVSNRDCYFPDSGYNYHGLRLVLVP